MPKLTPIDHMAKHASLGEQLVALVKDSGLLKPARRRAAAKRKPRAKRTTADKPTAVPKPRKATPPGAVAASA